MRIKNATVRSVELPSIEQIRPLIEEQEFKPLGENFSFTCGFENDPNTGELVTPIPGGYSFMLRIDEKILPRSVVKAETARRLKEKESEKGSPLSKDEKNVLSENVRYELIKKALIKTTTVRAFYSEQKKRLIVESATQSKVERLIEKISNINGCWIAGTNAGEWQEKITEDLTAFINGNSEALGELNPGDTCALKGALGKASFSPNVLDTAKAGLLEAISAGMKVDRIELEHETLTFKVGKDIDVLKSIQDFLTDDELADREELDAAALWRVEAGAQILMIIAAHDALVARYAATKSQ